MSDVGLTASLDQDLAECSAILDGYVKTTRKALRTRDIHDVTRDLIGDFEEPGRDYTVEFVVALVMLARAER